MKISHVTIHNFRSIKDCHLVCQDMLVLLGQNNYGKSNIMYALDFALNPSAKPNIDDFNKFAKGDDDKIWVEITFNQLTERENDIWDKYIQNDGSVCFRKSAWYDEDEKISTQYKGYIPKSNGNGSANLENDKLFGVSKLRAGCFPEFFVVPAIRDLSDESKIKSTTFLGKIFAHIVSDIIQFDEEFLNIQIQLKGMADSLNSESGGGKRPKALKLLESSIEEKMTAWDNVHVSVEVSPPDLLKFLESTEIYLDDGLRTLAEHKGHGLQRAVIFSLIQAWAKIKQESDEETEDTTSRKTSESVIFAIEEPELFLHPHAQRALNTVLRDLARNDNTQVLVCSHSTHFVYLDDYRDIALIRKPSADKGTIVAQCTRDLFEGEDTHERKSRFHMAFWVNPDRGEMLFAERVVFVEGETEKALLPFLAKKLGCYSEDVSIIDCGSKHNIPLYVAIANAFKLKYIVIHDEDPIPENCDKDHLAAARNVFEFNERISSEVGNKGSILMLSPNFEGASNISNTKGGKIGKTLTALDHFDALDLEEIPKCISTVVKTIYRGIQK